MKEKIKFIAQTDHVWVVRDKPFPAAKKMPQSWKDMSKYANEAKKFDSTNSISVKACIPTLDMLTAGYYFPLWADVFIKQDNGLPLMKWSVEHNVFGTWASDQVSSFEIDENYSRLVFKYYHGWTIKTPPGWSCLFISPAAYPNLPFKAISGIVDTDVFDGEINTPIIFKKGFEGIIEKGTPMFQIIPFKRSNWESEFDFKKPGQHYLDMEKLYSKIIRAYGNLIKDKKIYR
jgi:hypothetical protein